MSVIYPLNQRRLYTDTNLMISNIRNYWRKCFESQEEEISERVYNLDEVYYIIKTKPATKPKTEEDIYTRIKSAKPFHG